MLANAGPGIPAYDIESFGPIAAVTSFATIDEAAALAGDSEFGLVLGILSADIAAGLKLAERISTGVVHINDQTFGDFPQNPFGGMRQSGNPSRFGGQANNIDAYTEQRWITVHEEIPAYSW